MAHHYHGDVKKSRFTKMQKIVGHADHYEWPGDKAADRAYYQNQDLDPLTLPAQESIGPIPAGKPAGSQVGKK